LVTKYMPPAVGYAETSSATEAVSRAFLVSSDDLYLMRICKMPSKNPQTRPRLLQLVLLDSVDFQMWREQIRELQVQILRRIRWTIL